MSNTTYTPAQVVKMTGLSLAAIRNYCDRYAEWFSAGAVPPKGQPRVFTARDVDLVHFIRSRTSSTPGPALSHTAVEQALRDGDFETFVASHPAGAGQAAHVEAPVEGAAAADDTMSRDIVQIQALQIMLRDYTQREALLQQRADQAAQAAAARERELQTEIAELQRSLGRVEGELQAIKSRRPWWRFWQQPQG